MHGRLKVRTSAQEAERKLKEQQEKVKAYRAGMARILEKRAADENDSEMLKLTEAILSRNPDILTLWNIRRECLLKIKEEKSEDETQEIFNQELSFTEICLQANPKSYGAWHQRCWILKNSPEPDWNREVAICTKYLKMDERNFHVWDHRRYVVKHANVPPIEELEFCTEKIQYNFSNYSSWHARSKLLSILYPLGTDKSKPINERVLRDELELVLTAAFTDPNDSSAWFYQRWLLGYSQQELDIAAFKLSKTYAIISFTKAVNLHKCCISLDSNTKFDTKKWQPIQDNAEYDVIWKLEDIFELNNESSLTFDLTFVDEEENSHSLAIEKHNDGLFGIKMPKFGYEFGASVLHLLKEQLASCKDLLEFEPDSKWTLLTAALLMRAIGRKQYHLESLKYLDSLKKFDPMRSGYYNDLQSKWSIENSLDGWITSLHSDIEQPLDLSNLNLVNLNYQQYFCVAAKLNLEKNSFNENRVASILEALKNCNVNILLDKDSD